jgi:hypothetical protein
LNDTYRGQPLSSLRVEYGPKENSNQWPAACQISVTGVSYFGILKNFQDYCGASG